MTNREEEILKLIRDNPMLAQKELAKILGITRSSVAVHITNLLKKGYITGKGYILKEEPYVSIIGGANVDIQGFTYNQLTLRDSNPGQVKVSLGGVGRNIGENLVRLGFSTKLLTVLGDDVYGKKILDQARIIGLDMQDSLVLSHEDTSTYLSILDEKGDMMVAVSSMSIFEKITLDFIKEKKYIIDNSKLCIMDTNIPAEVMQYTLSNHKETDFFLDTVSTKKAVKVKEFIGCFHTIKPNKLEAEILTGIKIVTKKDLKKSAEYFLKKGVKRVFISLGEEGIYYNDGTLENYVLAPKIEMVNSTGAGDAFIAALAFSYLKDFDMEFTTKFAMTASILALSHENTINPNMSVENINKRMKEIKLC